MTTGLTKIVLATASAIACQTPALAVAKHREICNGIDDDCDLELTNVHAVDIPVLTELRGTGLSRREDNDRPWHESLLQPTTSGMPNPRRRSMYRLTQPTATVKLTVWERRTALLSHSRYASTPVTVQTSISQ